MAITENRATGRFNHNRNRLFTINVDKTENSDFVLDRISGRDYDFIFQKNYKKEK